MRARSADETDPLSDILTLAEVQTVVTGQLCATGPWGLHFPPPRGLKFLAVVRGAATYCIDGGEVLHLGTNDVLLMNHASPYVLASGADVMTQDGQALMRALDPAHRVLVMQADEGAGQGEATMLMGGHVSLDRERGLPLAQLLPPVLHIPADNAEAPTIQWLLAQLVRERATRSLGHQALTGHLAHMLFLQVLRLHLSRDSVVASSWLRVLADPQLLPAIRLMHAQPGRAWGLQELASAAAMSRTSFALRFRSVSGATPMAYLAQWRMLLAQHALQHDSRPIASWTEELGYASESAFSHAFKRIVGLTPTQYRRRGLAGA